ncbi:LLM class flavin-dependent oxidoreductase [Leucobacter aridicollis]|uniref:LLM class flavin-dependent oxidoreductase n=1 Tax=Leucobacter aridicollis TaxID=283878 RepID=UPI002168B288|nr:LLM class flavin-dependent oxidoreductase [Leucobacter aridicollis]MCS3427902.1 putative LLM family oxidoreductase [Leucobacter aridicollis]
MQLGVYSFGNQATDPATGELVSTAQAQRDLLEAIVLADQVGLEFFGIGEHHTEEMPASAASVILGAAAGQTKRVRLASAVTVLSTDDPVRIFQQFATLDALSNGRAEITAGRGSSVESYPLFGYRLEDYDRLYAEKLELLLKVNEQATVTWSGSVRAALDEQLVVPRPDRGSLPIWLGTGGSPNSTVRAGQLQLPVSYGIIGGDPVRFKALADLYRRAWAAGPETTRQPLISVGNPGFIGETDRAARDTFWPTWYRGMADIGRRRGFAPPIREHFDIEAKGGALFVGEPEQIANRIIRLHHAMGHSRQFLQMDFLGLPQRDLLRSIELLGTKVKPLVDAELGPEPEVVPNPLDGGPAPVQAGAGS